LDWGGAAGHYYLYSRALLPEVAIDYHCYEVPALCRLGRRLLPEVTFHEGADNLAGARFGLVISSSVRALAERNSEFLYIARLQTVSRTPSFVVRQRPNSQGYYTEYLTWFLNRRELLDYVELLGMELLREFVFDESWSVRRAPEKGECRGCLFRRRECLP
jgi:hypothetical protein